MADPAQTLRAAAAEVGWEAGRIAAASPIYRSLPVGVTDQPPFLNAVAALDTELGPDALLDVLLAVEAAHGRVRDVRWGPRTLDLDLVWFEGVVRDDPRLTLPHPRAHEREIAQRPHGARVARLAGAAGRRAGRAFAHVAGRARR